MPFKLNTAALVVLVPLAQGHFTFARLSINGEWHEPLRYIRNKTAPFEELDTPNANYNERTYNSPTFAATDYPASVRCGRDNMAWAADTEVLTVKAGDTIELAHSRNEPWYWDDNQWYDCPNDRGSCQPVIEDDGIMDINHPGPVVVHLSQVPAGQDVHEYDGAGEWVKIYTLGLEVREDDPVHWLAYNNEGLPDRFIFKLPPQTPAGQYLMRMDLIWAGLYNPEYPGNAQLYPTCAQIRVESEYSGSLPHGIMIPEGLADDLPGMFTSLEMYRMQSIDEGYVYPGGPLWDGENLVQDKPDV